ncbi:hypothetical protein CQA38_02610 [Campylobacter sp. MIT 12-5580]|uniref:outer membrane beta-barrel protein n=1 Tax=Campylobacter sp. MIT 12-5580 TaxID=2040651 RepID=UPI0010FA1448|nr:outer membrane beta-barrel protein [Campylobacter sp. MIT 12-5580]TKX29680.1 hypothetical protein CQA38_02610 [Campylobacter sp. MIT 12-5580]
MKTISKLALSVAVFGFSALNAQNLGEEKTGVLLGVSVLNMQSQTQTQLSWTKADLVPFGARLGYQKFDEKGVFGSRLYVDYHYSSSDSEDKSLELKQSLTSVNLDLLLDYNIPETRSFIGVFAGIHYTWFNYKQKVLVPFLWWNLNDEFEFKQKGIGFNAGVALSFASRHKIEVYYKSLPFKEYESPSLHYKNDGGFVGIGYQYNF